jgi:hypothetical protein
MLAELTDGLALCMYHGNAGEADSKTLYCRSDSLQAFCLNISLAKKFCDHCSGESFCDTQRYLRYSDGAGWEWNMY